MMVLPATVLCKGDKYSLKIRVKLGNEVITPESCSDIRIKIGNMVLSYSKQELSFEDEYWLFPLSQEFTLGVDGDFLEAQAQFKIEDRIYSTPVYKIKFDRTIFEETW